MSQTGLWQNASDVLKAGSVRIDDAWLHVKDSRGGKYRENIQFFRIVIIEKPGKKTFIKAVATDTKAD